MPPPRLNARHTIAEFMVAACTASASWCRDRSIPIHYRSQAVPSLDLHHLQHHASRAFSAVAHSSMTSLPPPPSPSPSSIYPDVQLLSMYAGKMATISGMQAAVTKMQPLPHDGIGADAYMNPSITTGFGL